MITAIRDLSQGCNETIADKWMYIPNDDTQKYSLCRLKLVVETFEHTT